MTLVCELNPHMTVVLMLCIFVLSLCEFFLILRFMFSDIKKLRHPLSCTAVTLTLIVFACIYNKNLNPDLPVYPIYILLAFTAVHFVYESVFCHNYIKNHLSAYAVKEATDDLPTGVCFANASGRILLCNRQMGTLSSVLIGSYPQTSEELENALFFDCENSGVRRIPHSSNLFRFPDKSIWKFSVFELPDGFRQITAQNVTALYEINEKLRAENAELKAVNEKLNRMYERLADRIREQEILDLKMRIHDNIGASLIAISDMMNSDEQGDIDTQVAMLQDAVSYLSDDRPAVFGTFEEIKQKAADMKVEIALIGGMPQEESVQTLINSALRVCITNCVVHAKGNKITVNISEHLNIIHVTVTNNGEVPKGKIVEGGGLSNLRKSIEAAGGDMFISHHPVFALILNLPLKEQ